MMKKSQLLNALNLFMVLVIVILLTSCSQDAMEQVEDAKIENDARSSNGIPGRYIVIVSMEPAVKNQKAAAILEEVTGEVRKMPGAKISMKYSQSLSGFAANLSQKQVALLKKDKRVTAVYQDKLVYLEETSGQNFPPWGLDRLDQRDGLLDRAYAYNATGDGVYAYIMDSGIRYSHEDFGQRATLGIDLVQEYPDEEYDKNNGELEPGNDCHGHGTHVAGTVGGTKYGVAKDVNLISVRVFSCAGITSWSRLILAVDWITENALKPAVVNMSIGGEAADPVDIAIENSIATGIHYVIAAGNWNSDACGYSPARVATALTVGASRIDNYRAHFSNFGDCVDIYAPGMDIISASITDDTSTKISSGTSMAAPHVAGLAALYLQKNPDTSPASLHDAIIANSTGGAVMEVPAGNNNLAYSLWAPAEFTAPPPPDLNLRAIGIKGKGSTTIHLVWDPTEDSHVTIYKNNSLFSRWYNTGEYSLTVNGGGKDSFKICEENYDNCSEIVTANFNDDSGFEPNQPPAASFPYVVDGLTVQFSDTSTDPDGTINACTWYFGDGYYTTRQNPLHTYPEPETYRVELHASDDLRASDYHIEYITLTLDETGDPDPTDPNEPTDPEPNPGDIELSARGYKMKGTWHTDLTWTPAGTSTKVDIYQNGNFLARVDNTGSYTDVTGYKGGGSLTYEVCEAESKTTCSNVVTVMF
ncbi:PKD domain-containing protein [Antarcticibacterium flavum]|uniref:PKD domain-containing protein n=1 Tax=Antarcticibacterium flavum TaxID=2058175 RepID=A0A5B7X1Q4_9FLAO|nr:MULTISPECIES: S8 family serine peptidase [Antarcticibacterium]MCM4158700.1 hypothetical protein [Antarcticibacterium sp. W02-3]QCY68553.1 PKD domain-containing protein [Antarcticibacterium flavum]